MSETPKRPPEFEPIASLHEKLDFLVEGVKTLAPTLIWTDKQKIQVRTHLSVFNQGEQVIYVWVPPKFNVSQFQDALNKQDAFDCFFSVALNQANIFFKATYLSRDTAGLKFSVPEQMFKVQRRKNIRFLIPSGHVLRVEFTDPRNKESRLKKKVIDVSAGGVSFEIDENELPFFNTGVVLCDFKFTIGRRLITVTAKIRHTRPYIDETVTYSNKGNVFRAGVEFTDILKSDQDVIREYVEEATQKYFARFL